MTSYDRNTLRTRVRQVSICEYGGITRPCLMDRLRAMKMAAAAGNGDDVQDRIEELIAQDSADNNDSCYFFRVTYFSCLCGCNRVQNLQAPKGLWEASKGYQAACQPQGHYGRTCSQALHILEGMCVEVQACAMDPMQVFPAGRAVSAESGMAVHRGDAKWR